MSQAASSTQAQSSPLYKLPTELRCLIWEYCYGELKIEVLECSRRLAYKRHYSGTARMFVNIREDKPVLPPGHEPGDVLAPQQHSSALLLPLAKVSRLISQEALKVLYSRAHFRFACIETLLYFCDTVPLGLVQSIRTVSLQWKLFPPPMMPGYKWMVALVEAAGTDDLGLLLKGCDAFRDMLSLQRLDIIITNVTTPWSKGEGHLQQLAHLGESCKHARIRVRASQYGLSRAKEMFEGCSFQFTVLEDGWRDDF